LVIKEKEKTVVSSSKFANLSQFTLVISRTVLSFHGLWKRILFLPCSINTSCKFYSTKFFLFSNKSTPCIMDIRKVFSHRHSYWKRIEMFHEYVMRI